MSLVSRVACVVVAVVVCGGVAAVVVIIVVEYIIFYNIIVDERVNLPRLVFAWEVSFKMALRPPFLVGCLVSRQNGARCCCDLVGRVVGHSLILPCTPAGWSVGWSAGLRLSSWLVD